MKKRIPKGFIERLNELPDGIAKTEKHLKVDIQEAIMKALDAIKVKGDTAASTATAKSLSRSSINKKVGKLFDKFMKEAKAEARKDFDMVSKNHPKVLYTELKKNKK